eukprot:TRINITY_DN102726_c0_g1_i1.p1 TRINITY_DN102726_c0_g1~~TRINITY_DN102726_c0_g1_i1.p1  ORF type:complete len:1024 (+),score=255.96 TRINITY_DN102726_c0_g1_i1:152-3223(+)
MAFMASTLELFFAAGDDVTMMGMVSSSVNEVIWFAAGFLVFRLLLRCGLLPNQMRLGGLFGKVRAAKKGKAKDVVSAASAKICADSKAGNHKAVLATWHREKHTSLSPAALEAVAFALVQREPDSAAQQLAEHLCKNTTLVKPPTVHALAVSAVKQGRPDVAQEFIEAVDAAKLFSAVPPKTRDQVLGGFAAQASADKVQELLARLDSDSEKWCSAANCAVLGFASSGHASKALQLVEDMQRRGAALHDGSMSALLVAACTSSEVSMTKVLEQLKAVTLHPESTAAAMATCLKLEDFDNALCLQEHLRAHQSPVPFAVLEPLLKLAAKHDEQMALKLLGEMRDQGMFLSEGLCGLILSRCGEARHLEMAEAVQRHLREHKMTTLATYKTLMKVYATCDLLDRACDLYGDICADGIVPDGIMRGCLVKFAVKCGREELSAEIMQATAGQAQDSQTYIQLIRAAGQKQDVSRAICLLRQLQASNNEAIEAPVFNCVLDVCIANSKFDEAEEILNEMREKQVVTLVTYNILMKGYAGRGDFSRAMRFLAEAQSAGLQADQSSFNCLISAAVTTGKYDQVWTVFDAMQNSGVEADNFTLAILMKLIRKTSNRRDILRALAVLDSCEADILKDDVLFNSVLDACIHLRDVQRLSWVLKQFEAASIEASVQNYGLIIKAYACLKRVDKCWSVWEDMTQLRKMVPSDVALSCMLDAVVTAGRVDEAVALFRQWETTVVPNTIIYSNLIKGFAATGDAERAMEMYGELKSRGLPMNIVVYSTLIDAQAKSGNPAQAQAILLQMEEDGCKPNTITYSSLLKAYCGKGDLEGALKVFEDMVSKGLKPDTVVFNTLLDGAVRCSQFSVCDQILTEMSNSGVEASCFTLSIVVKMWGKRRKLDRAFGAVREAVNTGRSRLDSKLCTCLISACFHNQQPKRALEALEEMKSWPRCDGPDNGTYEQLLDGLLRSRLTIEAATVALEATDLASRGFIKPLSVGHLKQLFRSLQQQQGSSHELLLELRRKLRAASLPLP